MFLLSNKIVLKISIKHYHQVPRYQSDLVLGCLSVPFLQKTSVQNFRTFTIILAASFNDSFCYQYQSSGTSDRPPDKSA